MRTILNNSIIFINVYSFVHTFNYNVYISLDFIFIFHKYYNWVSRVFKIALVLNTIVPPILNSFKKITLAKNCRTSI